MKHLQPHQQRVIEESVELQNKIAKLQTFIETSPVYAALPDDESLLLASQMSAMTTYFCILQCRIAKF